jgi:AcrR family transcriptional regulator
MTAPAKIDGRRARGERSRRAVLDAALAIASTDGLEGLTFGRLATELGISKGNLSVLFRDKETLQLATIDASVERVVATVIDPALAKPSPFARLNALCEGWYDHVQRRDFPGGCFMYATAHEYRARPGVLRDRAVHNLELWRRLLGRQIHDAKALGDVRADVDVRSAVISLVSYQNSAHLATMIGDDAMFDEIRELSRNYVRSLLA